MQPHRSHCHGRRPRPNPRLELPATTVIGRSGTRALRKPWAYGLVGTLVLGGGFLWNRHKTNEDRNERERIANLIQQYPSGGGARGAGLNPYPVYNGYDLDCADVNGPVRVTRSDPHNLDADGDGVGCEGG